MARKSSDSEIQQWRERAIENSYPYLMIDARYEKLRRGGEVISQGVLIVVGISAEGMREALGVSVADQRARRAGRSAQRPEPSRAARRALSGFRRSPGDAQSHRSALSRSDVAAVPSAFVRNILNHTAARDKAFVLAALKAITEAPTLVAARKALAEAVGALARQLPKAAAL